MIFPKSVFICEICGLLQQLAKRNCLIRKAHRATAAATAIDARCPRVGLLISWVPNQNQSGKQLWRQRASLASERFSRICALQPASAANASRHSKQIRRSLLERDSPRRVQSAPQGKSGFIPATGFWKFEKSRGLASTLL